MGGIDLDPASSAKAQETVKAGAYMTAADDGLDVVWEGRVWLNPPYEKGLVDRFIAYLLAQALRPSMCAGQQCHRDKMGTGSITWSVERVFFGWARQIFGS